MNLSLIRQRDTSRLRRDGHRSLFGSDCLIRARIRTHAEEAEDYLRIRNLLEREDQLRCFLYVVPNKDLAAFILNCFVGTTASLFVAFSADVNRSFAEARVIDAASGTRKSLLAALCFTVACSFLAVFLPFACFAML